MRLLALHMRGRRAGQIGGALAGVAVACWALAALADDTGMLVPVLGPLAAVSLLGFALGGDAPALERTTPRPWPRWRTAELSACALAAIVALLPALLQSDHDAGAALRNLAGLGGVTALGAVLLGPRLAWLAPTAWALTSAAAGPRPERWLALLAWPVAPGGTRDALAIAAALACLGGVLYARRGPAASAT